MHPDDVPSEYPNLYIIPQRCNHPLEMRTKQPAKHEEFAQLIGERCHWCSAEEMGIPKDQIQPEFRSAWKGGALVRKCPLTIEELKELGMIEKVVLQDANPAS